MKKISGFLAFISVLFILIPCVKKCIALEPERYTTESVSEQEKNAFLQSKNFRIFETETKKQPISCFAISEQGLIALGFNEGSDEKISIYSSNGQFLYGQSFVNHSSNFIVFYEKDVLYVFWGKSNYIASFDLNGNFLDLRKVINTNETADAYHQDRWRPANGSIGDIEYYAKGKWHSTYSQFIVEDTEGKRTTVYDISSTVRNHRIFISSLLFGGTLVIIFIIYKNKKLEKM